MATSPLAGTQMFDEMKRAIEHNDAMALTGMYDDRAVIEVVNQNAPPKHPHRISGKPEISRYFEDVCGRALKHHIEEQAIAGDHLAYVERCTYPDGVNVLASSMLTLDHGKVRHQTIVEAWDQ